MRRTALLIGAAGIAIVAGLLAVGRQQATRQPDAASKTEIDGPTMMADAAAGPAGGSNAPAAEPQAAPAPPPAAGAAATAQAGAESAPEAAKGDTPPASPAAPASSAAPSSTPAPSSPAPASPTPPAGAGGTETPPPGQAQTPPPADLKPIDLAKPLAEQAGVLSFGDRTIRLAGVKPTDLARICTGANGKEWPCGMMARTALRMYLRGRTVTCDLAGEEWQGAVTASCRYVKADLSQWLVQNGWAEAEAGSPLSQAEEQARADRRGIFGDDPRKDGPSTLGPAPRREDPLNPI